VPLALFWRKGAGQRPRFLNVFYGATQRPSDTGKVLSFLWNYRNLAVRVGQPIDLTRFVAERSEEGPELITRRVRRSLLIYLRREEKPVLGAALRPVERIEQAVLDDPEVREAMALVDAARTRLSPTAETRARRYLGEIAAAPSPTMLATLDRVVAWMFRRLFVRFEVNGLERIVEAAKTSPLVLVPSHRSHFDYVILSWLFYQSHLVPPLVAAGINLAFFPLGPIFRRAGAFFLRRSFDGNRLYATVFRSYVQALIKDGVTQEFFIEGTRSRTGKTLQPRLGMLGMVLDAFARGVRRDVAIVPVGFTYERLVEEGSMVEQRRGAKKTRENLLGLLRAGRVLQSRFGSVTVRFGEPISLAHVVDGEHWDEPGVRQAAIESLGDEICRRINGLITAGRSSVSAAALLGSPHRAQRIAELRGRVTEISELLDVAGLARSENLQRCLAEGRPEAAAELLLQSGLVEQRSGSEGELLSFTEGARDRLAYYRSTIGPALAWPAVLALALRTPHDRESLMAEASGWLDLLRLEYFPPARQDRVARFDRLLDHFVESGWMRVEQDGRLTVTQAGDSRMAYLGNQVRPLLENYRALFTAVAELELPAKRSDLLSRAGQALEEQLLLGEASYAESVCPTTLGNAFELLVREGVLEVEGNLRRPDTVCVPGPRWTELGLLRTRVARALGTG
jgi:glycerol-3-phosphate O-acyltransferase